MSVLICDETSGEISNVIDEADPIPEYGYRVTVTDKTVAETELYMEPWANNPSFNQLQFNSETNRRRIEVTGGMVSVSGKNAFGPTRWMFIQGELSSRFTDPDPALVSYTNDSFTFDVTSAPGEVAEMQAIVANEYEQMYEDQYRWRINPAGLVWLQTNGGAASGTAAQVNQYLQDGLLL